MDYVVDDIFYYSEKLKEIFPGIPEDTLHDEIQKVLADNHRNPYEDPIETMVIKLTESGAWGPQPFTVNEGLRNGLSDNLMYLFPDADPNYISQFCYNKPPGFDLNEAVNILCTEGYEKVEMDPLLIWDQLKDALPNADPSYLKTEAFRLVSLPREDIDSFLQNAIEKHDYPTKQEYLQQKRENVKLAIYKQFDVNKFLEIIPNPIVTFTNPDRVIPLNEESSENDIQYALTFLYNHYCFIRKKYIDLLFKWKNKNLVEICNRLDNMDKSMRKPRKQEQINDTKNVALLQEIAFLKNQRLIKRVLKSKDDVYRTQKQDAIKYNLLQECQCCFDDELIPEECYFCKKGCVFCKECVRKGVETAVGKGELRFPCNANCNSEFSLQTLQMVLPKRMFEKLVQKIGSEEAKKAKLDGLETCPFCDFAMIVPENEKLFKCINEDCRIESCRECRHKAHIPLRCNEIEYDEDVRRRTYIENKMTEALTRTCNNCKMIFVKENGCNKMTCRCGAMQCYLCGAAVANYNHFGSDRCALYTNDNEVNLQRVLASVQVAKNELGNVQIKFDPSTGIETFFQQ